jgi:hypothetical protein
LAEADRLAQEALAKAKVEIAEEQTYIGNTAQSLVAKALAKAEAFVKMELADGTWLLNRAG